MAWADSIFTEGLNTFSLVTHDTMHIDEMLQELNHLELLPAEQ